MAFKITYKHPDFPNDWEFDVTGVGTMTNGKAKTLNEEEEAAFIVRNRVGVKEYFKGNEMVEVSGTTEVKGGVESVLGSSPVSEVPEPVESVPSDAPPGAGGEG